MTLNRAARKMGGGWQGHLASLGLAVAVAVGLGGCASDTGLAPESHPVKLPQMAAGSIDRLWWKRFGDPGLDALMEQALRGSPDIAAAEARIRLAGSQGRLAVAALNPSYAIDAAAQREEFSALGYFPPPIGGTIFNLGTLQADFVWDLDWWGKHRAVYRLAAGEMAQARAQADEAQLALGVNLVRAYFALQADSIRLGLLRREQRDGHTLFVLERDRRKAGLASDEPVRPAQAAVFRLDRQAEALGAQVRAERLMIAALMGQPPQAADAIHVGERTAVPQIPATLPADRIGLRPDVAMLRAEIGMASANITLAKIQFYPDVNLSGFAGVQSIGFENMFRSGSQMFGVGPAFHLPIFDNSSLRAGLARRDAEYDMAVQTYNRKVIDAMREAADASLRFQSLDGEMRAQRRVIVSLDAARSLAQSRYAGGLDTGLPVLRVGMAGLGARADAVELHRRRLDAVVDIVQAMGGWPQSTTDKSQ